MMCSSLFDERPDPACEVDAQADERDRNKPDKNLRRPWLILNCVIANPAMYR